MQKIILDKSKEDLIVELFKAGNNITVIQKTIGVGRKTIESVILCKNLSLKTKSQLIVERIPELANKQYLEELYNDKKFSMLEIATQLNTNEQVIKTAFKRLHISPRSTKDAKIASVIKQFNQLSNIEFLKQEYLINKKSPKAIAKIIGCSSKAVETALSENKIKKRNHKQSAQLTQSTPQQKVNAKIARNLRTRFWIALSGKAKMASAVSDLGCSIEDFKKHCSDKFYDDPETKEKMTWDNYGKWEIDHIDPLSKFDLSIKENQVLACKYTNLRPLWVKDNRQKSNKILGQMPQRVPMYLVVGPAGSGKSWVCDQLDDVNYISYDVVPKEQHFHYMVEMSKNGKPIIFDPFRKVSTFYRRYASMFDIKLVVINEKLEIVESRLRSRGSNLDLSKIESYVKKFDRITNADFKGTSQEVLDYLKKELSKSQ